ncbi:hypothetical protein GCM10010405_14740 [Streptomyces macrosporus]|uniref:Uncharacterized protein n=1 Tax=Streptomyces macrosporus TaxID=44032 RepID=A0ABN3JK20_9ACTN
MSGVRQACIIHHNWSVAATSSTQDAATRTADNTNTSPQTRPAVPRAEAPSPPDNAQKIIGGGQDASMWH